MMNLAITTLTHEDAKVRRTRTENVTRIYRDLRSSWTSWLRLRRQHSHGHVELPAAAENSAENLDVRLLVMNASSSKLASTSACGRGRSGANGGFGMGFDAHRW